MARTYAGDLELARQCAAGDPAAWDRFVLEYRPVLYRAADALDGSGRAREVADGLYAELFGVRGAAGAGASLFHYFQGRSSLATWLRAVLAQRYVDTRRADRRVTPLPDDFESADGGTGPAAPAHVGEDLHRARYVSLLQTALAAAVAALPARDRLRLACYYVQALTLAETGRLLNEHEATVSRQLSRTRRVLRSSVEAHLREEGRLSAGEMRDCLRSLAADPGPIDLHRLFGVRRRDPRKEPAL